MNSATAVSDKNLYRTAIQSGNKHIIADEPTDVGGQDLGFAPTDLLAAALASCTSITLRMYCDRKQIAVDEIRVSVHIDKNEAGATIIDRRISIAAQLSEEQHQRILQIASACPVSKILSQQNSIITSLNN